MAQKPVNKGFVFGPWWKIPLIAVFALLVIPIWVGGLMVVVPCLLLARWVHSLREGRWFREMERVGRTLPWAEVEEHLRAGEGTLIIEQGQQRRVRLWWTPEDVVAEAPVSPTLFDELDWFLREPAHPFVSWCAERYLSPVTGTARVTRPVGLKYPRGFVAPDFFTARWRAARVVATVLVRQSEIASRDSARK